MSAIEISTRYLDALVKGDREAASAAVVEGLDHGLDTPTLLLQVIAAAQREIGERWHRGDLSIARESWSTQVTAQEIERVFQRRRPVLALGHSVVVATLPGEKHSLPARIVAGLLSWRGWAVDYLGEGPPVDDLVNYVRQRGPDLVAISITMATGQSTAEALCRSLRAMESPVPILLGGSAAAGWTAESVGADAVVADALQGLEVARELVGLGGQRDLDAYLTVVGRRIHAHRRTARISQAELAERAGLTRPYLSAVERGKQNITLEAALKIAVALEVGMAELLEEGWR